MKTRTATALGGLVLILGALTACASPSPTASTPTATPETGCVILEESNLVVLPGVAEVVADIASDPAAAAARLEDLAAKVAQAQTDATTDEVKSYLADQEDRLTTFAESVRTLPVGADASEIAKDVATYATEWVSNYRTVCEG